MDDATVTHTVRQALGDEAAPVRVLDGGRLDGVVVFEARLRPDLGGTVNGIVSAGGEVVLKVLEAARHVVGALGPDAKPEVVAALVGTLERGVDPTWPVVSAADVAGIARPEWRAHVGLPTVTALPSGQRRFEYWVRSNRTPLWRSRLTVDADGAVTLERTPIWDLAGPSTTP